MKFSRTWAMPNSDTFQIPAISEFVKSRMEKSTVSVDPFSRNVRWATHTNDLNPTTIAEHHMDARDFLAMLIQQGVRADLVVFDPPYSPRQISECYQSCGLKAVTKDTQNARLYGDCRKLIAKIAKTNCVVLSFGWNSVGMGKKWGFEIDEIMLCCHGGAHNDTICMAESCRVLSLGL